MDPNRFARLKEILLEATDLSESERRAFLADACGDDAELRREVESILTRDGRSTRLPKLERAYRRSGPVRSDDVAPDGRFLVIKRPDDASLSAAIEELFPKRIQVVQNWFAELQEKLPEDE